MLGCGARAAHADAHAPLPIQPVSSLDLAPLHTPYCAQSMGVTGLQIGASKGFADVCQVLISNNANLDLANENGETPLMYASHKGHMEVVQLLTNSGALLTLKNKSKKTAQDLAKSMGNKAVVQYLKDYKPSMAKPSTSNIGAPKNIRHRGLSLLGDVSGLPIPQKAASNLESNLDRRSLDLDEDEPEEPVVRRVAAPTAAEVLKAAGHDAPTKTTAIHDHLMKAHQSHAQDLANQRLAEQQAAAQRWQVAAATAYEAQETAAQKWQEAAIEAANAQAAHAAATSLPTASEPPAAAVPEPQPEPPVAKRMNTDDNFGRTRSTADAPAWLMEMANEMIISEPVSTPEPAPAPAPGPSSGQRRESASGQNDALKAKVEIIKKELDLSADLSIMSAVRQANALMDLPGGGSLPSQVEQLMASLGL